MINLENFVHKKLIIIINNNKKKYFIQFRISEEMVFSTNIPGYFFYFLGILFETILQKICIIYLNRNHLPLLILPSGWTLAQGPNAKPWKMH